MHSCWILWCLWSLFGTLLIQSFDCVDALVSLDLRFDNWKSLGVLCTDQLSCWLPQMMSCRQYTNIVFLSTIWTLLHHDSFLASLLSNSFPSSILLIYWVIKWGIIVQFGAVMETCPMLMAWEKHLLSTCIVCELRIYDLATKLGLLLSFGSLMLLSGRGWPRY